MKRYLITLSIGPVQSFIAAARRTRDLWFGSYLLSEISKAAAKSFYDNKAKLIFPAPPNPDVDLLPQNSQSDSFNVGNKLLVTVETDNPAKLIEGAKTAAVKRWVVLAKQALGEIQAKNHDFAIRENIWDKQLHDQLEFFAAWVWCRSDGDYIGCRQRLDRLLNARKNTREFHASPIMEEGYGLPKSSLDGQRETVLKHEMKDWQKRKLWLSAGEQLDCAGLVKRLGGDPDQFTPISRIAIDPWLRGMDGSIVLDDLSPAMDALKQDGFVSAVNGNNGIYQRFAFDAQLLYPFRMEVAPLQVEGEDSPQAECHAVKQRLVLLKKAIDKLNLYPQYGEPSPYFAILVADGDRMGDLLNSIKSEDDHKSISQQLAVFAKTAPEIIRNNRGHCIYAGGDDVLALLPLDKAIECADELATCFNRMIKQARSFPQTIMPTLSVGLGIGHFMEPMGRLLATARRAEILAKGDHLPAAAQKNALAIILQPRSGAAIEFRESWKNSPKKLLDQWIQSHIEGLLPTGVAYELREESYQLDWGRDNPGLIKAETQRILKRKRTGQGASSSRIDNDLVNALLKRAAERGQEAIANELILTQRIAQACSQARKSEEVR